MVKTIINCSCYIVVDLIHCLKGKKLKDPVISPVCTHFRLLFLPFELCPNSAIRGSKGLITLSTST